MARKSRKADFVNMGKAAETAAVRKKSPYSGQGCTHVSPLKVGQTGNAGP